MPIGSYSGMYKIKKGHLLFESLTAGHIDCDRWKFLKIQVQSKDSCLKVCREIAKIQLKAFLITAVSMFGTWVDNKRLNQIDVEKSLQVFGNASIRGYHVRRKEKEILHNVQKCSSFCFVTMFILEWTCRLYMRTKFCL